MGLLPLDEVQRRLKIVGQSYVGVRPVSLERIVGSVDRSADFGRDFKLRRSLSRSRLAALRAAFPDGDMPAIEVYELGGLYFVADGHHRVALAHQRGRRVPRRRRHPPAYELRAAARRRCGTACAH
jgi:hypothetical protein